MGDFLDQTTIDGLIALHDSALMDRCKSLVYQKTGMNTYNQPVAEWVEAVELPCKFRYLSSKEVTASAVSAVAELRLKWTQSLDPKQRIRVTHLHGAPMSLPNLFEVVSGGMVDYVANVYQLSLVNDGTP